MQASRTISVSLDGTPVTFPTFKGAEVGCYNCHNGPSGDHANTAVNPTAGNLNTNAMNNQALSFVLPVTGVGATARVVSQPVHGSVGVSNNVATYFPEAGFVGTEMFTFAAYDGSKNSLLATGTVNVAQGSFSLTAKAFVPSSYPANWSAPFTVIAAPVNVNATPTFDWNFGDGSAHSTNQYPTHSYALTGSYHWSVGASVQSGATVMTSNLSGTILISAPAEVAAKSAGDSILLSWPLTSGDVLLEESQSLDASAHWTVSTNGVVEAGGTLSVTVPNTGSRFFRLRKL